jgi:hypothetical protein
MWHRAPDGERYKWRLRCEGFRMTHAKFHRHGAFWSCYERSGNARTTCIIRLVWGGGWRGEEAVRVARCESGFRTHARNGQYRGIFQMGSSERARFGHGSTVMAQARAAHSYYRLAGGWGPWECKP